jgi:hypothetical protein
MAVEQETIQDKGNNLNAVFWGGSLLWAGVVFGLEYFGNLPQVGAANAWSWIFLGMGVCSLLLNTFRLFGQTYSNASAWDWVWGLVFLGIGATGFADVSVPWWLFLIAIGIVILANTFIQQRNA